jgi:hypothetical protein
LLHSAGVNMIVTLDPDAAMGILLDNKAGVAPRGTLSSPRYVWRDYGAPSYGTPSLSIVPTNAFNEGYK